jgi:hypothetical protein
MVAAVDFTLGTEIILALKRGIRSKQHISVAVSEENRLVRGNDLALLLEAFVRVKAVDDPDALRGAVGGHGNSLLLTDRRADGAGLSVASQTELLSEEVLVRTQLDLLAEADELVSSKHVHGLDSLDVEH